MRAARRFGRRRAARKGVEWHRLGSLTRPGLFAALELLALTARWHKQALAIFGHGAASDLETLARHFVDDFLVGHWAQLVFLGDDVEELLLDGVPRNFVAAGRRSSAAEKALEGEDPARRLNPLVVDGSADRGDMHTDAVGDLLHLERFDEFGTLIEKV